MENRKKRSLILTVSSGLLVTILLIAQPWGLVTELRVSGGIIILYVIASVKLGIIMGPSNGIFDDFDIWIIRDEQRNVFWAFVGGYFLLAVIFIFASFSV